MHDYRLSDGKRVVERFLLDQRNRLTREEREQVTGWLDSRFSLFEVIGVRAGEGVQLRELLTGDVFEMRDRGAAQDTRRWSIVCTRLVREGAHYVPWDNSYQMAGSFRASARSRLLDMWDDYCADKPDAVYADFFHDWAHRINQFMLNELRQKASTPPLIVTAEGDLMELTVAEFEVRDYERARSALSAAEEFVSMEDSEDGALMFNWWEAGESLELLRLFGGAFERKEAIGAEQGGKRTLGTISLKQDELTLETTSERRVNAGKALLVKRLGDAIHHRDTSATPVEEFLDELGEPEALEPPPPVPPEVQQLLANQVRTLQEHWIDQQIPALDGQTPREAAQSFGGRIRLVRLLKHIESTQMPGMPAGMNIANVTRDLGLTEQEFLDDDLRIEDEISDAFNQIRDFAYEDQVDEALEARRAFFQRYPIKSATDLEFGDVYDLLVSYRDTLSDILISLNDLRRHDESIALCEEAAVFDPSRADAYRGMRAEIRAERGEATDAEIELRALAERNPDNADIAMQLANVQAELLARPKDALATLRRAAQHDEEGIRQILLWWEMMNLCLSHNLLDEAEQAWHEHTQGREKTEGDYGFWIRLMLARRDESRAREALGHIRDERLHRIWAGEIEAQWGQPAAAREAWTELLRQPAPDADWEDEWEPWVHRLVLVRDSETILAQVDSMRINTAFGWYYYGMAHAMNGNLERASECAQKGNELLERHTRIIDVGRDRRVLRRLAEDLQLPFVARAALGLQ